jgi:hypothetical protein
LAKSAAQSALFSWETSDLFAYCRSGEGRSTAKKSWMPAYAGMTNWAVYLINRHVSSLLV